MTTIKRCEKCDGIIKSYDKVIYVDDGAGYVYHEGCVAMHPSRWAVYDGEYFLGMTDDYNRLACDVLGEGEYEEGEGMIKRIYDSNYVNVISLSGGKDSTALLLKAIELGVEYEAVFADTGHEHEETYKYIDYLEKQLGIKVRRVKADLTQRVLDKKKTIEVKWRKDGVGEEIIQSALNNLKPTGIPMLDLALWKGGFPSRKRQFCTEQLKVIPMIEQVYEPIWESGKEVIVWQGVRRAESEARKNAKEFEKLPDGYYAYRPLVEWSARDVFEMHNKHGVEPNPLYKLGMGRVGCMPCINTGKEEMFQIQMRFPEVIDRVEKWEEIVSKVSKQGKSTFFTVSDVQGDGVRDRASWSMTARGGKQLDLIKLIEMEDVPTCSSQYGLCE